MHARLLLLRERVPDLCSGCLSENVGRSSRMKLKEALLYRDFLVLLRRFAVIERLIWKHATFSMYWLYLVLVCSVLSFSTEVRGKYTRVSYENFTEAKMMFFYKSDNLY